MQQITGSPPPSSCRRGFSSKGGDVRRPALCRVEVKML